MKERKGLGALKERAFVWLSVPGDKNVNTSQSAKVQNYARKGGKLKDWPFFSHFNTIIRIHWVFPFFLKRNSSEV